MSGLLSFAKLHHPVRFDPHTDHGIIFKCFFCLFFSHKEAKRQKSLPAQIKQEPPSTPEHARDQPETLATAVAMTEEEVREQEKAVWEKPALPADDKSRHHEFDEYFADMLL